MLAVILFQIFECLGLCNIVKVKCGERKRKEERQKKNQEKKKIKVCDSEVEQSSYTT